MKISQKWKSQTVKLKSSGEKDDNENQSSLSKTIEKGESNKIRKNLDDDGIKRVNKNLRERRWMSTSQCGSSSKRNLE